MFFNSQWNGPGACNTQSMNNYREGYTGAHAQRLIKVCNL